MGGQEPPGKIGQFRGVAERLREEFSEYVHSTHSGQPRLTLSVGAAQVTESDDAISLLERAEAALDAADRLWIPVQRDWRLNERHYGALQGLDKAETKAKYGEDQFMQWRRSYDTPPPPIERGSEYSQDADPRYADIGGGPLTECLADVVARFVPYFEQSIVPDLQAGKTVLIAAHGNSLRALVKYLDGMSDADVVGLNIPTGIPLRYDLDADLKPTVVGGTYLDPEAAAAGAAAVAAQGAK